MTTTITATPRVDAAAVDLRITRDDTTLIDTVAEWTFSDAAAATAELANWTNASTFMEELEVTNASVRALTGVTAGQRYFIETYTGFVDAIKAGSTSLVTTRETPFVGNGARRNVAEIIAPSGGFNLVGGTLGGAPLLGYKVTRLDDQRLMFGPVIPAGNESAWTAQVAAPYGSTSKDRFGNDLRFNWTGATGVAAVPANALKGYRSFTTTTGRNYMLTVAGQSDNTGSSVGLTFEVLNGATVLASATTSATGSRAVRLTFTAPSTSVTLRVSNRQPFNSSGVGGSASFSLQAVTLERLPSGDLSTAPYTITTLSRTDSNGVRQVRLLRGGADLVAGILDTTDYEPALQGLVAYTVVTERVGVAGSREIATTSTRIDQISHSEVVRTNLFANSLPTSSSGWTPSGGESVEFISEEEGVQLVDPVGGGGGYIIPTIFATPGVGRWAAVGVDIKPLFTYVASNWRLFARVGNAAQTFDQAISSPAGGIPFNKWSRQVVAVQQTDASYNRSQVILWPTNTPSAGPQFRARRMVVAFADTQAQAEAAVATYFEGTETRTWTEPVDGGNVFMDAATPQLRFDADLVETYTASNATSAVFHDVIGRADPVVSEGVQRLRDGSMRVWFPTYEAAKDAIAAFGRGKTMLWRSTDNAGLDMYFRSLNVSSAPYDAQTSPRRWYVEVQFREVATPNAPLEGDAAWNFAASAERNTTLFDSFSEFATFADLLNGPEEV